MSNIPQPEHGMYTDKVSENFFTVDTRRRAGVAAEEIGVCLETPQGTPSDLQGAY